MKRTMISLALMAALCSPLEAQTTQDATATTPATTAENKAGEVISMDKQLFLNKVFDYTTGATEWKYQGDKPAIIDFYATWCGPCRMVAPLLKSLAKEYQEQIVVYKVDTDKQKELAANMGIQSLPTIVFIPMTGQPQVIVGAADKETFRRAIEEVLLKEK